jgi:hypothetical protein
MLEHFLSVSGEMLRIEHGQVDVVVSEQVQEQLLAFDLGKLAEVTISPKKIESRIDQPTLPASSKLGLKLGEVGTAFMDDHNLTVDDGLSGDSEGTGNLGETFGPVETTTGEGLLAIVVQMNLDPITVVFDFVDPLLALRSS